MEKTDRNYLFFRKILILLAVLVLEIGFVIISYLSPKTKHSEIKKAQAHFVALRPKVTTTPTTTPTSTSGPKTLIPKAQTAKSNDYGFCLEVPILMYHHIEPLEQAKAEGHSSLTVDPSFFDQQMQYLISYGYQTITPDQLADNLLSHSNPGQKKIILTFDDGYEDIYTYAYPIIQKYHLIANLMIPAGLLENPGYLKWSQLKEMVNSGLVNAYDHTWSHASLGGASEEKVQFEVMTSKKELEQNLGKTVDVFVYPYGSYSLQLENTLRSDGFRAALSSIPGFWQCDSFIMNLHRTRIGNAPLRSYGL